MSQQIRFDGRVAIVTGGGSGIGRAHALLLGARGAKVVVNELGAVVERAESVAEEIRSVGGEAVALSGRIGSDEDARALVQMTIERFGRLDIIVNNAGIAGGGTPNDTPVEDAPTERFERLLSVNVVGPLQLNRAAWPHMVRQRYGRILFTSSATGQGWMRRPDGVYEADYAGAKAAVLVIARQTAGAGMPHNIKANTLLPWAWSRNVEEALTGTELGAWMQKNLRADQVAAGVALLLHEECPVTGEALSAEGGRVARIFFAATRGYFNPDLTPEDVVANWDQIFGSTDVKGMLVDAFEQTQPREERVIEAMPHARRLPELSWIAAQPVQTANLTASVDDRRDP